MSKHIYIDVAAKIPTIGGCVKLSPNKSYEGSIIKDFDYTGQSGENISFTNSCSVNFLVPAFILFTDTTNGGNFEARIEAFNILAGQTLNVPVKYFGIHKSATTPINYNITLNGISAIYKLNITTVPVNAPPVITNIDLVLENGEGKVFSLADFNSHYSDLDGDALDAVILEGDVSLFRLNGLPIVSGQEIPVNLINSGLFVFLGQVTDQEINVSVVLKAKDDAGSISN